jgi:hypothetical protein
MVQLDMAKALYLWLKFFSDAWTCGFQSNWSQVKKKNQTIEIQSRLGLNEQIFWDGSGLFLDMDWTMDLSHPKISNFEMWLKFNNFKTFLNR